MLICSCTDERGQTLESEGAGAEGLSRDEDGNEPSKGMTAATMRRKDRRGKYQRDQSSSEGSSSTSAFSDDDLESDRGSEPEQDRSLYDGAQKEAEAVPGRRIFHRIERVHRHLAHSLSHLKVCLAGRHAILGHSSDK